MVLGADIYIQFQNILLRKEINNIHHSNSNFDGPFTNFVLYTRSAAIPGFYVPEAKSTAWPVLVATVS